MRNLILTSILILSLNSFAVNRNIILNDTVKTDSIKMGEEHPVNIFYELLGSSVWMSLNYQQTIFARKYYSLDFLVGINNGEFSEFDFANSHFFLLNRFLNKSRRFFVEFGPGFKLGGSIGERKLGYDFSWNTSIMKVFKNNLFIKFNTTFSLSYLYKLYQNHNNEATYSYGYASFPIGLSFGYRFLENNKSLSSNGILDFSKNIISINSILGLGYERLLYKFSNNALYLSINPNFYVFKKYDVSEKAGYYIFDRNFINYVQQINPIISTEFGVGNTYYQERFSVLDRMFSFSTNQINLNIGIRIVPYNHFIIVFNYSPALFASNYNYTYNCNYVYNQLNRNHNYKIANKFFISIGYAWGE
jgi:hypothetical protein